MLQHPSLSSNYLTGSSSVSALSTCTLPSDVRFEFSSFTELRGALLGVLDEETPRHVRRHPWTTEKTGEIIAGETIPPSIPLHIGNSNMLGVLMHRAVSHWCCIGFKVAPIQLELIRNWQNAPLPIVYCVASISLVTFTGALGEQSYGHQSFARGAAMVFYEQARKKMDDIVFDGTLGPNVIQAYFCLSYTSNFLRLSDHMRTWSSLAVIALQQQAQSEAGVDDATLLCWYRWYYIDAWVCLSRNSECLLPDDLPPIPDTLTEYCNVEIAFDRLLLIQFANLTQFMRSFIRAMHSGALFRGAGPLLQPSELYYDLTQQLQAWYDRQPHSSEILPAFKTIQNSPSNVFRPRVDVHLHLCYHSMRLVILFQFLHPNNQPPAQDILIDCLDTNLQLLLALQHLKDIGCDQSTYHHMFFAIHNTARRIYAYDTPLRSFARDQLQMNLLLMQGTQAYTNDTYALRAQANIIVLHLQDLGIDPVGRTDACIPQPRNATHTQSTPGSGTFVFRLQAQTKQLRATRPRKPHLTTFTFDASNRVGARKMASAKWADRIHVIDIRSPRKKVPPSKRPSSPAGSVSVHSYI